MMADWSTFFKCWTSPTLYRIYGVPTGTYIPNRMENIGTTVISYICVIKSLVTYTSPIITWILYRKGYINMENIPAFGYMGFNLAILMGISYCIRSVGRATNPTYRDFLKVLETCQRDLSEPVKRGETSCLLKELKQFEFEFYAWPTEFQFDHSSNLQRPKVTPSWRGVMSSLIGVPCSVIGYAVMHTFGIRLMYPGSITILNYILRQALLEGREDLILNHEGERFKLKTADLNYIDTMFVDKRKTSKSEGKYLVICSEGNAGFYENGIMPTAIAAGFSVLGWNHPGFGCSTGMPYLDQEHNAMDAVMQFAVVNLKFKPDHIILYGWSIGGYSTAYAAQRHPDVKQVIVDATFDDVLPLAQNQMPDVLDSIVKATIKCYADLNVANHLSKYPGPIKMIRRTQDEVIATDPSNISSNRGNFLLEKILRGRYPALFNKESEGDLLNWLATSGSSRDNFVSGMGGMKPEECKKSIQDHLSNFPSTLGNGLSAKDAAQLLICLADWHMVDYKSTHCTPLPTALFQTFIKLDPNS